jgi:hypothetical protein
VLGAPADALAERWAVGVAPADFAPVAARLPGAEVLVPGRTLVVDGPRPAAGPGMRYVARLDGVTRRAAFANTEPLAARQWYLPQTRAWSYWPKVPELETVRVAVIDSGIDHGHPEFAGRVVAGRSFIGGSWAIDSDGHGTFISGILAADPFNGVGIAGLGINVELVVGKVVQRDGAVSLEGEIRAIRWAVDRGARVINLSLGGLRNPHDPRLDTFSPAERDAVAYARAKGVVVVTAVGNGTDAPGMPWQYANWPAALPHVIGVGALRQNGEVPSFSNRDKLFLDLSAPGQAVFSTIPRNLVDPQAGCSGEPYSDCGPFEFREAIGTSFAAPQVAAAAALLLGQDPSLTPDQVAWLLQRSAADVTPQGGCGRCTVGRDLLSGWGRLDVRAALKLLQRRVLLPRPDVLEPNDGVGALARAIRFPRTVEATLDYWDDPIDVYAIRLAKGEVVTAGVASTSPGVKLSLLRASQRPGRPDPRGEPDRRDRAAQSSRVDREERLTYRAPAAGTYYLEVRLRIPSHERAAYRLALGPAIPT